MKRLVLILFVVVAAVQLAVPAYMIARHESTLRDGDRYLFRCAPIDPVDAFRGRYVRMSFDDADAVVRDSGLRQRDTAWARLQVDGSGFAHLDGLYRDAPEGGPYLRVRFARFGITDTLTRGEIVSVELPFSRYYMDEDLAQEAEAAYRKMNRARSIENPAKRESAYVAVRIRDGHAVIEELYLAGLPVREYLESR